jgi:hypothetical protein
MNPQHIHVIWICIQSITRSRSVNLTSTVHHPSETNLQANLLMFVCTSHYSLSQSSVGRCMSYAEEGNRLRHPSPTSSFSSGALVLQVYHCGSNG